MKKLILAAAMMIITGGIVSAQTGNGQRGTNKNCPTYVDKDKNGVCDNFGTGRGQGLRQGNGMGNNKAGNANFKSRRGTGNCVNQGQCPAGRNGAGNGRNR